MPFRRVKRRYPRWVVTNWTLRYQQVQDDQSADGFVVGDLINVSRGGICFESDSEVTLGKEIDLELTSEAFPAPIVARGLVMWCRRSKITPKFEIGVEFGEVAWDSIAQGAAKS